MTGLPHGNDTVARAMHHEERGAHLRYMIDGAVLVDHEVAERQEAPGQHAHIHHRGERRLEHERPHWPLQRQLRGHGRAERLAIADDVLAGDP